MTASSHVDLEANERRRSHIAGSVGYSGAVGNEKTKYGVQEGFLGPQDNHGEIGRNEPCNAEGERSGMQPGWPGKAAARPFMAQAAAARSEQQACTDVETNDVGRGYLGVCLEAAGYAGWEWDQAVRA